MLPKIQTALFPVVLPVSQQSVKVRQILSREYKALLNASTRGDESTMNATVIEIIRACTESSNINIDELTTPDIEFLFIKIYSLSVENQVRVGAICKKKHEDGTACNSKFTIPVNLEEVVPSSYEQSHTILFPGGGIELKYPKFGTVLENTTEDEQTFAHIAKIWSGEGENSMVFIPGTDFSIKDFIEFMGELPVSTMNQIRQFVANVPTITWTKEITCPKCGSTSRITYRGIDDFLA